MRSPAAPLHARGQGFALLELAIALVVLSLLLAGSLGPLAARGEMRTQQEADKALADIRDALLGFAVVNGRLPCPAAAAIPTGTAGAGAEARAGRECGCVGASSGIAAAAGVACPSGNAEDSVGGVLPWAALGLPETDPWGRRFSYRINTRFGRDAGQEILGCTPAVPPTRAGFALCSSGTLEIRATTGGTPLVTGGVPAIVVSHGKNGLGAYTPQGTQIALVNAGADEEENADGDPAFVSNVAIDDRLAWIPTQVLMYRMISAGMLP